MKRLLGALVLALLASTAWAQTFPAPHGTACLAGTLLRSQPASYASANSTNTAQALPSVPSDTILAVVTVTASVNGGSIRYRDDGGTPTALVGMPASPSVTTSGGTTTVTVCQPQLSDFRFVTGPNGGAHLDALYYVR